MTKEVMVTLSGLHMADDEQDTVELVHIGEYYERSGIYYILFDEHLEGISQPVKNRIKIKDHYLEVQKRGPVTTNMIFEEGKVQSSTYSVPYGSFLVDVHTAKVNVCMEEDKLEASASYGLNINGARCADCDIRVKVESRGSFRL